MAHFAEVDDAYVVIRVIVVSDEHEMDGERWCHNLFGGRWKRTSYNNGIRKNYAGAGYLYDTERDAFLPPKPYPSWLLREDTCNWDAPIPIPQDGKAYIWNEAANEWVAQS